MGHMIGTAGKRMRATYILIMGAVGLTLMLGVLGCCCFCGFGTVERTFGPYGGVVQEADTAAAIPNVKIEITWRSSANAIALGPDTPVMFSYWRGSTDADGRFGMPQLEHTVGRSWLTLWATFEKEGYAYKVVEDASISHHFDSPAPSMDIESVPSMTGTANIIKLRRIKPQAVVPDPAAEQRAEKGSETGK